jgi:hypothetical protein
MEEERMNATTPDEALAKLARLRELRKAVDEQIDACARIVARSKRPPIRRRSRNEIPECGTESAYQRHRYYGEDQDDACRRAHAEHARAAYAKRRAELDEIVGAA